MEWDACSCESAGLGPLRFRTLLPVEQAGRACAWAGSSPPHHERVMGAVHASRSRAPSANHGVGEQLVPVLRGAVGGDDGAGALVAPADQVAQALSLADTQPPQSKLVQDQQVGLEVAPESGFPGAIGVTHAQVCKEPRGHAVQGLAGSTPPGPVRFATCRLTAVAPPSHCVPGTGYDLLSVGTHLLPRRSKCTGGASGD